MSRPTAAPLSPQPASVVPLRQYADSTNAMRTHHYLQVEQFGDVEAAKALAPTRQARPQGSSWKVKREEWFANLHPEMMTDELRADFICRVYAILTYQMAITVGLSLFAMCFKEATMAVVAPIFTVIERIPYPYFVNLAVFVCLTIALKCYQSRYPLNFIILTVWTVYVAFPVALVCGIYQWVGAGFLVVQAFTITLIVFASLSLYALTSGKDFTWMGGMLYACLACMICYSLSAAVFGFSVGILYSVFGVLLFCGFVLYDTSRLLHVYGPEDAFDASIELYLDILNLFVHILEILTWLQGESEE